MNQDKSKSHGSILVALSTAAFLAGCGPSKNLLTGTTVPIATVTVAVPEKSMVQDSLEYTGRIEPSQRVEVRSRLSGYLQAIKFRDGQQVQAGDVLFVIDQRPFVIARDRAQASLAQASARMKLASAQFNRIATLQKSGASSTDDLDRSRSEFEAAEAALHLSQAELQGAELELSFSTIRSPINGTISDHRIDVGNFIVGGTPQSSLLTTIVAQSPVRAMIDLSEIDYTRLRQQKKLPDRAHVSLDGITGIEQWTIDFVDAEISARSGTVRMRATNANIQNAIKPGSFAHIRIPVGAPKEQLLVPDAAIQSDQTKKLVLVVDANGKVAPKKIELGGLFKGQRVVLSGLSADEKVIVSGAQRVRPGDSVVISKPKAGA